MEPVTAHRAPSIRSIPGRSSFAPFVTRPMRTPETVASPDSDAGGAADSASIAPLPAELLDATHQDYLVAAWNALRDARQVPFAQDESRAWAERFTGIMNEAISYLIRHARSYGGPATSRSGFDHLCVGPSSVHRDIPEHDLLVENGMGILRKLKRTRVVSLETMVDLYERAAQLQVVVAHHQGRLIASGAPRAQS
jgi:hypothetical protein